MTVQELIDSLRSEPPEAEVIIYVKDDPEFTETVDIERIAPERWRRSPKHVPLVCNPSIWKCQCKHGMPT